MEPRRHARARQPPPPALPPTCTIAACHTAQITPATINTSHGDRLNLDLAIWAAFANARIARERAEQA